VTVNVFAPVMFLYASPIAVHTVVLVGNDELSAAPPLVDVIRAPPPRRTFPTAHVAVAVT
jgi:hypothetical protein